MTKCFGHYLPSLNNYYLSLWHSLPSVAHRRAGCLKSVYVGERRHGFCGELVLKITFYKFYQVEVHQAAVEGTDGLDVTEFTLLFLGTE